MLPPGYSSFVGAQVMAKITLLLRGYTETQGDLNASHLRECMGLSGTGRHMCPRSQGLYPDKSMLLKAARPHLQLPCTNSGKVILRKAHRPPPQGAETKPFFFKANHKTKNIGWEVPLGQRCLLPGLATRVQSLEPAWLKERTD